MELTLKSKDHYVSILNRYTRYFLNYLGSNNKSAKDTK